MLRVTCYLYLKTYLFWVCTAYCEANIIVQKHLNIRSLDSPKR